MLINVFRNQKPASAVMVLLIFLLLWIPGWWSLDQVRSNGGMPLFGLLFELLGGSVILFRVLTAAMLFWACIVFSNAVNRQDMFKVKNNLALFFGVFLAAAIPEVLASSPAILALPFLALTMRELFRLYFDEGSLMIAFNASIFLSLATLMYAPSVTFFPLLFIAILINGHTDWRHISVILIGYVAPAFIAYSFWVWYPDLMEFNYINYWSAFQQGAIDITLSRSRLPLMIVVLILAVTGGVELALHLSKKRVSNRKNFLLMLWATVAALVGFVLAPANELSHFAILGLPVSLVLANLFYYFRKPFWGNVLAITLLITALISAWSTSGI